MKTWVIAFLLAVPFLTVPLRAEIFSGDSIDVIYYYPNLSTVYEDDGAQVAPATFDLADGGASLEVNDATLTAVFAYTGTNVSASFNGFEVLDETSSPITSVTVDPATNLAGFSSSNVSFTGDSVTVNWQGLSHDTGSIVQLDLNSAAPEPASLGLLALGLIGLIVLARRRQLRI